MPLDLNKLECALWLPKSSDLKLIKKILLTYKGKITTVTSKSLLVSFSDTIVFVDENYIDDRFFDDDILLDKLEKLELFLVIVGKNIKLKRIPPQVNSIDSPIIDTKKVSDLIDKWQHYRTNLNLREQALTVKLNRLFFIYHKLFEGEYLYMDDILKMASVTKRTILRDLKTLKEVLVTKKITFDEEKKAYIMEDII
jgi:hypothetical protein